MGDICISFFDLEKGLTVLDECIHANEQKSSVMSNGLFSSEMVRSLLSNNSSIWTIIDEKISIKNQMHEFWVIEVPLSTLITQECKKSLQ